MDFIQKYHAELDAEKRFCSVLWFENLSDGFLSGYTGNQFGAAWASYLKQESVEGSGLRDVERIAESFLNAWTERKKEMIVTRELRHDAMLFVARKVWEQKRTENSICSPDLKQLVILTDLRRSIRSKGHEAFNRAIATTLDEKGLEAIRPFCDALNEQVDLVLREVIEPHLNKLVQQFTGQTPNELIAAAEQDLLTGNEEAA